MRCFNHPEIEAVGTCKVCQKGLCHSCVADLGHSIACKGKHENQAEAIHNLVLRNVQVAIGKTKYVGPAFYAFMGAVFLVFSLRSGSAIDSLTTYMGAAFLVIAVVLLVINRRARSSSSDTP